MLRPSAEGSDLIVVSKVLIRSFDSTDMAPISNIRRVVFEIHTNRQQYEDGDRSPYSPFAALPSRSFLFF